MSFLSPLGRIFELDASIKIKRPTVDKWQDAIFVPQDDCLPDQHIVRWKKEYFSFVGLISLSFVIILARLFFVQIVWGDFYFERSENNHLRIFDERALRGVMTDRHGEIIVGNNPSNSLTIVPADIPEDEAYREALASELAGIIEMSKEEILERIDAYKFHYRPIEIKKNLSHEATIKILGDYQGRHGIEIKQDFERNYHAAEAFAHVTGYLSEVTKKDIEQFEGVYKMGDRIGKTGLEAVYEGTLRGHDSQKHIIINAAGDRIEAETQKHPVAGTDLMLTIDKGLQTKSYQALKRGVARAGSEGGVVIAMDPNTFEILALVNYPAFDTNLFNGGIKGEEVEIYQELTRDEAKPFLNKAISGVYPPGSVYKLVTAAAALQKEVVEADTRLYAPGALVLAHDYEENIEFLYPDWKKEGHGTIPIDSALASSADTYFYQIAGGYESQAGVGIEYLSQISTRFGLGRVLGIDLPGEVSGVMPTPEWKYFQKNEQWYQGDTFHVGIGQGYLLTTPLQVASFTAAVANGGVLLKPHLVKQMNLSTGGSKTIEPTIIDSHFVEPEHLEAVRRGMRLAITSDVGTAKALQGYPYQIAGKTGTAQYNNNEREHAWFTAFAPYQHPEVVVTVLVEGGGEGSLAALPVAAEVITEYFARKNAR